MTCVDRYGNQANPINVSANVYGESFQSTLSNRTVVATRFGNGLVVKWKDKPGSCVLNYKNEAGEDVTKYILGSETNSYLLDFGSDLSYATYAVPENNAADTFYVAPVVLDNYDNLRSILSGLQPARFPFSISTWEVKALVIMITALTMKQVTTTVRKKVTTTVPVCIRNSA